MTLDELRSQIRALKLREIRADNERVMEFVVTRNDLPAVSPMLEGFFGVPLKPEGEKPSEKAKICADPYGGIRAGQTLYYKTDTAGYHCAMLWPWSDGVSITIKIFSA